jgi:hypothetical protein
VRQAFEFFVTGVQPAPVSVGWAADSSSLLHLDSGFRVRGDHDCVKYQAMITGAGIKARARRLQTGRHDRNIGGRQ